MNDKIIIPPADIRYRIVNQEHSEKDYLAIGRGSIETILNCLRPYTDLERRSARVLDFGCGCARAVQPLLQMVPQWTVVGTDIDSMTVDWSRANVRDASFEVNDALPPLAHGPESFDLIYALSVFSHLNAEMEDQWLLELTRLLKLDGFLYITFTGKRVLDSAPEAFPREIVEAYRTTGFAYFANIYDDILPKWYQTSLQSGEYVTQRLARLVPTARVLEHRVGGHMGWQDSLLVQRGA